MPSSWIHLKPPFLLSKKYFSRKLFSKMQQFCSYIHMWQPLGWFYFNIEPSICFRHKQYAVTGRYWWPSCQIIPAVPNHCQVEFSSNTTDTFPTLENCFLPRTEQHIIQEVWKVFVAESNQNLFQSLNQKVCTIELTTLTWKEKRWFLHCGWRHGRWP